MHRIGLGVLIGLVAAVLVACGGDSKKNPHDGGDAGAGGDSTAAGNSGPAQGGSGPDAAAQGGSGGTTSSGGASSTNTTGEANAGAAGAPATDGSSGNGSGGDATDGGGTGGGTTVSGTGGNDLIEPPPNCQSVRQSEDTETCSYEYTCDGRTHFDNCRRESDGVWACECGTFSTPKRYFEIEGVAAIEACRVIAEVCEGEYPLSPTRTCRAKESTVHDDTCSARITCGHAIDLGPGIVARAVENIRSECEPTQNTVLTGRGFDCSCIHDASGSENYVLTAASIDDVCEPLVSFCTTEELPVFTEEICEYGEAVGVVEWTCPADPTCQGCVLHHECRGLAPIAPDVSIVNLSDEERQYVVCRPQEGELQCFCQAEVGEGVYGDDTVPAEVLDVCSESRTLCPL